MLESYSPRLQVIVQNHLRAIEETFTKVRPRTLLEKHLPVLDPDKSYVVLSIGKMAEEFERALSDRINNVVQTFVLQATYDNKVMEEIGPRKKVFHLNHPLPTPDTFDATSKVLKDLDLLLEDPSITLLVLITGGASAAFALPETGIEPTAYISLVKSAMDQGFSIRELNMVRGFIDSVKVGKLSLRYPETPIHTLIISDVVTDDPSVIGGGPTVAGLLPDTNIGIWLRENLPLHGISLPYEHLYEINRMAVQIEREAELTTSIIGTRDDFLRMLRESLESAGFEYEQVDINLSGDVEDVAERIAFAVAERRAGEYPPGYQNTLIFAGEPTVNVQGIQKGQGGRVSTLATIMISKLRNYGDVVFIGVATDGKDGSSPHPIYISSREAADHLRPLGGERKVIVNGITGKALSMMGYGVDLKFQAINFMDIYLVILA